MTSQPEPTAPAGDDRPPSRVLAAVDWTADQCARIGMAMIVLITGFLFYEVVARYLFLAPTIWTQDISITLQVWFTYLGMAWVLRNRDMIRITAVTGLLGQRLRKVMEAFSLSVILLFSVMAAWEGFLVVEESIRIGRHQPTMLELPNWVAEVPVFVGFLLLAFQSLAELIRLPGRAVVGMDTGGDHFTADDGPDGDPAAPIGSGRLPE